LRSPLLTTSSFNCSNFARKILVSKSRRSCGVCWFCNSDEISLQDGLHVIVRKISGFPLWETIFIPSWYHCVKSWRLPVMTMVVLSSFQQYLQRNESVNDNIFRCNKCLFKYIYLREFVLHAKHVANLGTLQHKCCFDDYESIVTSRSQS